MTCDVTDLTAVSSRIVHEALRRITHYLRGASVDQTDYCQTLTPDRCSFPCSLRITATLLTER
jgi:hypothetical protein